MESKNNQSNLLSPHSYFLELMIFLVKAINNERLAYAKVAELKTANTNLAEIAEGLVSKVEELKRKNTNLAV